MNYMEHLNFINNCGSISEKMDIVIYFNFNFGNSLLTKLPNIQQFEEALHSAHLFFMLKNIEKENSSNFLN